MWATMNFYHSVLYGDNPCKAGLWNELHTHFMAHPEVIQYAANPTNTRFAAKYTTLEYIKEKKNKNARKDFKRIVKQMRRTGSAGPPGEARHPHFVKLKELTCEDPSFWPTMTLDSSGNGPTEAPILTTRQEDEFSYAHKRPGQAAYLLHRQVEMSSYHLNNSIPAPATLTTPAPTPTAPTPTAPTPTATPAPPAPTPVPPAASIRHQRNSSFEFQQTMANSSTTSANAFTSFVSSVDTQYSAFNQSYIYGVDRNYEARRLDRESRERLAVFEMERRERMLERFARIGQETIPMLGGIIPPPPSRYSSTTTPTTTPTPSPTPAPTTTLTNTPENDSPE
ncbi:hypothetical protein HPULCUR_007766 [Helicostylum pulchrum]|uniref:Uncharacterized protein n=1 Tax=Helicostylum pulchrum TaxID=562976 RepID=A0ABP9Y5Q2_9FUNG